MANGWRRTANILANLLSERSEMIDTLMEIYDIDRQFASRITKRIVDQNLRSARDIEKVLEEMISEDEG